eukprot:m.170005 g.170005  ORF g.170005 m.170005 type:complete len:217 (-) comp14514_c1_seq2:186-836(-)
MQQPGSMDQSAQEYQPQQASFTPSQQHQSADIPAAQQASLQPTPDPAQSDPQRPSASGDDKSNATRDTSKQDAEQDSGGWLSRFWGRKPKAPQAHLDSGAKTIEYSKEHKAWLPIDPVERAKALEERQTKPAPPPTDANTAVVQPQPAMGGGTGRRRKKYATTPGLMSAGPSAGPPRASLPPMPGMPAVPMPAQGENSYAGQMFVPQAVPEGATDL